MEKATKTVSEGNPITTILEKYPICAMGDFKTVIGSWWYGVDADKAVEEALDAGLIKVKRHPKWESLDKYSLA